MTRKKYKWWNWVKPTNLWEPFPTLWMCSDCFYHQLKNSPFLDYFISIRFGIRKTILGLISRVFHWATQLNIYDASRWQAVFSNANNTHKVDAIDPFSLISLVHQLSRPTKHVHLLFLQLHSAVVLLFPLLLSLHAAVLGAVSARTQWNVRQNKRVWTPFPSASVSFLWGTYHSMQHNKHLSPQKWTILILSAIIKHQNCPFSLHEAIREFNKNQKQIPQEAPHLTPAHCSS